MHVWLAGPADAEPVTELLAGFRDWWGRSEPATNSIRGSVERLLVDEATDFLLAAAAEGDPAAGVCQLRYRHSVWREADDCLLEDLFVRDGARRAGLGAALVAAALDRAWSRGCRRIVLDANEANAAAIELYTRFGFTAWSDPPGGNNLSMRVDRPGG